MLMVLWVITIPRIAVVGKDQPKSRNIFGVLVVLVIGDQHCIAAVNKY